MSENGIFLNDVSKQLQDFYLQNINITIPLGNIGFLIGHNGAGKTTILHILSGNTKPDKGTISDIPKDEMGFIFDENHLPEKLTCLLYTSDAADE